MRYFKPGDRVRKKSGGPLMKVQRYAREYKPWIGWYQSDQSVECSWYEPGKGYQCAVFHQNNLVPEFQGKIWTVNRPSGIKKADPPR